MPSALVMGGALANRAHEVSEDDLVAFLLEQVPHTRVFRRPPAPGRIRAAALDWQALLGTGADLIAYATALWAVYDRFIKPKLAGRASKAGGFLFVQVRRSDGVSRQFAIGREGQDEERFLEEFTAAVRELREGGDMSDEEAVEGLIGRGWVEIQSQVGARTTDRDGSYVRTEAAEACRCVRCTLSGEGNRVLGQHDARGSKPAEAKPVEHRESTPVAATSNLGRQHFYHGSKADLCPGHLLAPNRSLHSSEDDPPPDDLELTDTLDAAAWQGELAAGEGPGRIYIVEPIGLMEHAPDLEEKYPVQARWWRSREPLRVTGACTDEQGRPLRFFHGTKAHLKRGDVIEAGHASNFGAEGRVMKHVYLTGSLDAAIWGAELAVGEGRGRIYMVEPTGAIEDDPNLTNMKFPGNPTKSYRSLEPLRVTGEVVNWRGHSAEAIKAMKDGIDQLRREGSEATD